MNCGTYRSLHPFRALDFIRLGLFTIFFRIMNIRIVVDEDRKIIDERFNSVSIEYHVSFVNLKGKGGV